MKISKYLKLLFSLNIFLLSINSVANLNLKTEAQIILAFQNCFRASRIGSTTERANLKQFAATGNQVIKITS